MAERVLVLGATSAIAAEVARVYWARGARLHLVGRNGGKLQALLDGLGPSPAAGVISSAVADFSDLARNDQLVGDALAALGGADVVLIAHGELGEQLETERDFARAETILNVNFTSVVSLLVPLSNALAAQGRGCIGVITSVAGERGRPRNYTYGAAKGGLNVYLQGLRSRLFRVGVKVVTIKLGPVNTPMTRDHAKNALFAEPDAVARSIVRALGGRSREVYVPSFWGVIMPVVKHTPERLFQLLPFLSGR
jgi:decaprenylphospho-beta-D-erythro-pentofuranosid-2-ulose 2-reductase